MKEGVPIKKDQNSSISGVFNILVSIDARMTNIEERMSDMATTNDLEMMKEGMMAMEGRLLDEIRPIARAVDKDAHTIIDHEKRIIRLEKHAVLK
jgi:hypothetical protein